MYGLYKCDLSVFHSKTRLENIVCEALFESVKRFEGTVPLSGATK